jgi:uncharacterized DUF497 family protein
MNDETVYDFEWDPAKALANVRKHGITFDQAATVLLDELSRTVYDEVHSQQEERWFMLGLDESGRLRRTPIRSPGRRAPGYASFRLARRPDEKDVSTKMNLDWTNQ